MSLAPGVRIGSYEVVAAIGAGGMGEVYRARDLKLGRDVALKILPDAFANDAERLARFQREAQMLASLNHPNIGAIYGVEDEGGTRALVLELVEGPTLADRIAAGPIPLEEALEIATQLAEVLEVAHARDIIHRDLKPANIKLRPDGTVKVLDFGLAKALTPPAGTTDPSFSPTISVMGTQAGLILGTAAYMAPEQARGRPVDKRADVWAFGAVLYEMLTGHRAFPGEDVSDTLATVLKFEPDWSQLPADTPPAIRRLLRRCLVKDPKLRLRECGSALVEIHDARTGADNAPIAGSPPAPVARSRSWSRIALQALAGAALVAIGGAAVWTWMPRQAPAPASATRFSITLPDSDELRRSSGELLAMSPDGQTLVYRGTRGGVSQLYRRDLAAFDAVPLAGTDDAVRPFFSHDGQWIAFGLNGTLRKMRLAGGPSQAVSNVAGNLRGAAWTSDERIIFGSTGGDGALMQVPAGGGEASVLYKVAAPREAWLPQVVLGGDAVLFTLGQGSLENAELQLLTLATGEVRTILRNAVAGRVLETGHLVFLRGRALWAVPIDPRRLEVTADEVLVIEGVRVEPGGAAQFAIGGNGSLAYIPEAVVESGARTLVSVGLDGKEAALPAAARDYQSVAVSPDGAHAVVQIGDTNGADVWVTEIARGTLTRITSESGFDGSPVWMPDGKSLVFASSRNGRWQVVRKAADGTGSAEVLTELGPPTITVRPWSVSPDGSTILLDVVSPAAGTGTDIVRVAARGPAASAPLIATATSEGAAVISPDGRWLAYTSIESGAPQVYLQQYPELRDRRTIDSGGQPTWSRDGRTLYYLHYRPGGPPNAVMRVAFDGRVTAKPIIGNPEQVIDYRYYSRRAAARSYEVLPADRLLLMTSGPDAALSAAALRRINVVINWQEELKRIMTGGVRYGARD